MPILPQPSVSPLPSWASRPPTTNRSPGFAEVFAAVWGWLRGREPDWRQRVKEQRIIDRLAEELGDEPEIILPAETERVAHLSYPPTAKAKR